MESKAGIATQLTCRGGMITLMQTVSSSVAQYLEIHVGNSQVIMKIVRFKLYFLSLLVILNCFIHAGCGGGGGDPTPNAPPPSVASPFGGMTPTVQTPPVTETRTSWVKTFGGSKDDMAASIVQLNDGGYVIAGFKDSEKIGAFSSSDDIWVLKLNANGDKMWERVFGVATDGEEAASVDRTTDGGCVVTGYSGMNAILHGMPTNFLDLWIARLDDSGNTVWEKNIGANEGDFQTEKGSSVQQTDDGGFVVVGMTNTNTPDQSYDILAMKLDASGNTTWSKTFGGAGATADYGSAIRQTPDGGYILLGSKDMFGPAKPNWILKLDASGNKVWDITYGSQKQNEILYSVRPTFDGGFILAGAKQTSLNYIDGWLVKLDSTGNVLWNKTYGDWLVDALNSVEQAADGGFIAAGATMTNAMGTACGGIPCYDFWALKTDSSGNKIWSRSSGTEQYEGGASIALASNGGFAIAGFVRPTYDTGDYDWMVMKLDAEGRCDGCFNGQ